MSYDRYGNGEFELKLGRGNFALFIRLLTSQIPPRKFLKILSNLDSPVSILYCLGSPLSLKIYNDYTNK